METRSGPAVRVGDAEIGVTIDIDIQQVEEAYEPGSNNAEMDQNARKVMAQQRRKATTNGYRKGLACW